MNRRSPTVPETVRVHVHGHLPGAETYAEEKVRSVFRYAPEPILDASVRLTRHEDPAVRRKVVAQANLDLRGRLIRAQVEAETAHEAIDRLAHRLRRQLEKSARNWQAIKGRQPKAGSWRHGEPPSERPPFFPRPAQDREVVRHKAFTLAQLPVDEAAIEMDLMDYDFHLFTERGSGEDSVLYRTPEGYRLAQVHPRPKRIETGEVHVSVSEHPAARLSLAEAIERLDLSGQPFLFYLDAERGRGQVIYHRYDGHYGLITPPA